jgi:hypothetical protein
MVGVRISAIIRTNPNCSRDRFDIGGLDLIILPSPATIHNVILHSKDYNRGNISPIAAGRGDNIPRVGPNRFLELPNEISLRIFHCLLPMGQVFHFTPTTKGNIRLVLVERLFRFDGVIPGSEEDKLGSLSTLSTISRHLTAITYNMFFRENQFVFEIATAGLTSILRGTETDVASWNKIIRAKTGRHRSLRKHFGELYQRSDTLRLVNLSIADQTRVEATGGFYPTHRSSLQRLRTRRQVVGCGYWVRETYFQTCHHQPAGNDFIERPENASQERRE